MPEAVRAEIQRKLKGLSDSEFSAKAKSKKPKVLMNVAETAGGVEAHEERAREGDVQLNLRTKRFGAREFFFVAQAAPEANFHVT